MIRHTVWQRSFDFFGSKPVVVEPSAGQLSSDAGLLSIREFDPRIGLTEPFAPARGDRRRQRSVDHPFLQMVRMRIDGVLADDPYAIVKCEAHAQGTNRRAIVTNRPEAGVLPRATYDEYVMRGERENRHKELKCGPGADRLSDHRSMANLFRLSRHCAAHNLLVRLRRKENVGQAPACRIVLEKRAAIHVESRQAGACPTGLKQLGDPGSWRRSNPAHFAAAPTRQPYDWQSARSNRPSRAR